MRDHYEAFKAKGAEVVSIGMGLPAMAADFREQQRIPFPVLVDRTKESYRALGLRKGSLNDYIGPKLWKRLPGLLFKYGGGRPKQDVTQMGGALVIGAGGKVKLVQRSEDSDQNIPPEKLLAALG